MYIVTRPDELLHYGVRGMRWGVRKDKSSGGALRTAFKVTHPLTYMAGKKMGNSIEKTRKSKGFKTAQNKYRNLTGSKKSAALKKYRSKNIDGMSDKDLQKAVNRMNLEKQYRSLTKIDFYSGKRAVDTMNNNTTAMKRAVKAVKYL